tara:strand:+ start:687 stop:2072 length:1386 start_codon:yes stop_codon:yes gene_type:complete
MKPTVAVVGGGFKGIVTAKHLADQGANVVLIEQGKKLGGIHFSIPWDGFQLDLGCHVFSNENDMTTNLIFDLLGEKPNGLNPKVKSVFNGIHTEGIECPDFSHLPSDLHLECLLDFLNNTAQLDDGVLKPELKKNLEVYLTARYGAKLSKLLEQALQKILRTQAKSISSVAFSAIPARRVNLVEPSVAGLLKQLPNIDELLLNPNPDNATRDAIDSANNYKYRCFYPANGGMGAFAKLAKKHLDDLGVQVKVETAIQQVVKEEDDSLTLQLTDSSSLTCSEVFWTSGAHALAKCMDLDIDLSEDIHNIPMVLFYFDVPETAVGEFTWVQDFDTSHLIYRASAPSTYGKGKAPKGRAYVLAEVLTDIDADIYQNSEAYTHKIWDELVDLGAVSGVISEHFKILKTPVSYKFPKSSFYEKKEVLDNFLNAYGRMHLFDEWIFGKAASVNEIRAYFEKTNFLNI